MDQDISSGLFSVHDRMAHDGTITLRTAQYHVLLFNGKGSLAIDFTDYEFEGNLVLFTSPFQHITLQSDGPFTVKDVSFHGDFYCIEYHKKEVACNGLLFNNIYAHPFISVHQEAFNEFIDLTHKLSAEIKNKSPYSAPILKAYLQLILAIGSKIKSEELASSDAIPKTPVAMESFSALLEEHFIYQRSPSFYANELALSSSVLAKRCKQYYGKTPSQLIQDRVILEAKKLIHLTHKSVKEIAALLNFEDEHYFSRYFKKNTSTTPTLFRERVGISIVADLSID